MTPTKLSDADVQEALQKLPRWTREDQHIVRQHKAASYPEACALLMQVAFLAERHDHHPDVEWRYRDVTLRFTTHDVGGLSDLDVLLAEKVEALLR